MFRVHETHVFGNSTYPGNVTKTAPKCLPNACNAPKSVKRPPLERQKVPKDDLENQMAAIAMSKLWESTAPQVTSAVKDYVTDKSYD